MTNAPGRKYLLITGIIMIIIAIFEIRGAILGLIETDYLNTELPIESGISWGIYFGYQFVSNLYWFFAGLLGIIYRSKLHMSEFLWILSLGLLVLAIVTFLMAAIFFDGIFYGLAIVIAGIIYLSLSFLYFIGAKKNLSISKQAA